MISGAWLEGTTGIWTGSEYRIYADAYRDEKIRLYRSSDLVHWTQSKLPAPDGMRHGTVIRTSEKLVASLKFL